MEVPDPPDYYFILDLDQTATGEDITKAYRRESFKWHPDRNFGRETEVQDRFVKIKDATDKLMDPEERKLYDIKYEYYLQERWARYREHVRRAEDKERSALETQLNDDEMRAMRLAAELADLNSEMDAKRERKRELERNAADRCADEAARAERRRQRELAEQRKKEEAAAQKLAEELAAKELEQRRIRQERERKEAKQRAAEAEKHRLEEEAKAAELRAQRERQEEADRRSKEAARRRRQEEAALAHRRAEVLQEQRRFREDKGSPANRLKDWKHWVKQEARLSIYEWAGRSKQAGALPTLTHKSIKALLKRSERLMGILETTAIARDLKDDANLEELLETVFRRDEFYFPEAFRQRAKALHEKWEFIRWGDLSIP